MPVEREPINSSTIVSAGYDTDAMVLEMEFDGGRVYQYFDLPASVYEEFKSAASPGGYFNSNIRNHYRTVQL